MKRAIYNPANNDFQNDLAPIVRKGVTLYHNLGSTPERSLVKKKGEPIEVKRKSFFVWSAYERCINKAFREAKKRKAKQVWIKVIGSSLVSPHKPGAFVSNLEADEVRVSVLFYE